MVQRKGNGPGKQLLVRLWEVAKGLNGGTKEKISKQVWRDVYQTKRTSHKYMRTKSGKFPMNPIRKYLRERQWGQFTLKPKKDLLE